MNNQNSIIVRYSGGLDFIGDIHACYEEFITLLVDLGYRKNDDGLYVHPDNRKIVSLGDVMSRGPESLKTMVFFKKHVDKGLAYMIDSNHGWKIARWLNRQKVELKHGDENVEEEFNDYETKFGKEATDKLRVDLKELLLNAPSHHIFRNEKDNDIVAVHAGIKDKYIGTENKKIKDFCRYGEVKGFDDNGKPIRGEWYLNHKSNQLIIWGHDPKPEPLVINNTINIDQGAVFGGRLTAYRFPEKEFLSVKAKKDYSGINNPYLINN